MAWIQGGTDLGEVAYEAINFVQEGEIDERWVDIYEITSDGTLVTDHAGIYRVGHKPEKG